MIDQIIEIFENFWLAFVELYEILVAISATTGRWIRIAVVVIVGWPLILLVCNVFGSDVIRFLTFGAFTPAMTSWLPLLALMPVFLILGCLAVCDSLIITALTAVMFNHRSRRFLRQLGYLLGYELLASIYLCVVPLSNDQGLVPILILVLMASWLFRTKIRIWKFLALQVIIITLIFFLGGRTEAKAKVTHLEGIITGSSTDSATGPTFTYKPQNRYCDGHQYYDPDYDFHSDDPDVITIVLHDGCNGDRRILPVIWASNYTIQLSQNPGDYVSVACTEHGTQSRVFTAYNSLQELFDDCTIPERREPDGTVIPGGISPDFSPQGRGVLTLTRAGTRTLRPALSLFDQQ